MFCTQCGHSNPAEANFCNSCGASLAEQAHEEVTMAIPILETTEIEDDLGLSAGSILPGSAVLVVKRGPEVGARYELTQASTTAGRSPDADILLDDITVSRKHAEFQKLDNQVRLRDVGSLNGTYVNQQPIEETALHSGDEVQIGKFKLLFFANLG